MINYLKKSKNLKFEKAKLYEVFKNNHFELSLLLQIQLEVLQKRFLLFIKINYSFNLIIY